MTTHERSDTLSQRYRLSLDRTLTRYLSAAAGGSFMEDLQWRRINESWSDSRGRADTLYARLSLGSPVLTGSLGVDRNTQRTLTSALPTYITESYTAYAAWRPVQLPSLELRASHVDAYDADRRTRDTTTDTAGFTMRYEAPSYDLRYLLTWTRAVNHVETARSSQASIDQSLLGTRSATLFGGRTSAYASATLQARNSFFDAQAAGATSSRQRLPVAGLSAVQTGTNTATDIELAPNPDLVNGNLGASASVNLGFRAAEGGDTFFREVGARFGDVVTPVNTIYVWLVAGDNSVRPLPPAVAAALATTVQVYRSADNRTWTPVPLVGPATASPFESRLEITIPRTAALHLKVVARGLAAGVTTETIYRDLFVTEIQFFDVRFAAEEPRRQSTLSASATAFARTAIVRSIDLAHDVSLSVSRDSESDLTRYAVVNGVSAAREVWESITANARVARQDQDVGLGHEGFWQWTAALVGRPLPTAFWSLIYSGNARTITDEDEQSTMAIAHSVNALGRADLYDGISGQANAVYSNATQGTRNAQTGQASGTLSLTPNKWVTVTAGALFSRTRTVDLADASAVFEKYGRVDGSLSLTPAPALSATGTVSRVLYGARATTLGTVQGSYFPLRGDLQLSLAYSKTLDTAAEATTEFITPSLRWNLRRGVSLTSSYTWLQSVAPAQIVTSRALGATLLITL